MPKVAVVTDSTASLPAGLAEELGILVVPLQVVIGATSYDDGIDPEASPEHVAQALKDYVPVSTSRPSPAVMGEAYARAAAAGAEEIVSVHLSAEVSATYESALLAARKSPVPVHTVDTRQIGAGTGYAARAAARAAAEGATGSEAAEAARKRAELVSSLFYVDTLEHLRRGGRMGAAAALLGSALAVKPVLHVQDGRVVPLEKVRTSTRALHRLVQRAVEAAGDGPVSIAVHHLAAPERAELLARDLRDRLPGLRELHVSELGAAIGAHVGPGAVGVVVAPFWDDETHGDFPGD